MSSISMDAPTVKINAFGLKNLINVIFEHEPLLKEFGGIKIQLSPDCALALKKRKNSPVRTTTQQIMKVNQEEPIYSVHKMEDVNGCTEQRSSIMNEEKFWSSLADLDHSLYRSSVSILPHKTLFYQKWHRKYFAIHSVPRQSLLKLGGNEVLNEFMPCLTRAHGPGAIYPLATARQRLFSLVYHHQGGARHWYIIPAYEREALKRIVQRQDASKCLEHQELLIDPVLLEKYHIRYHRLVQHANEFVVISAGTLTQSFTEDANWNESVVFALPSWIQDGHANFRDVPCQCNIKTFSTPKIIDVSIFKNELIQKYIDKYLNTVDNDNVSVTETQRMSPASIKPPLSLHSTVSKYDEFPMSLIASPDLDFSFNEPTNEFNSESPQQQMELNRKITFHNTTHEDTPLTASSISNSQDYRLELLQTQENQHYHTTTFMQSISNFNNNQRIDDQLSALEDFMNIIAYTPATTLSTHTQTEEPPKIIEKDLAQHFVHQSSTSMNTTHTTTTITPKSNLSTTNNMKKRKINENVNRYKTLLVLGLRNDVSKSDLYHHFIGCIKVTLKQCQTSSQKYAFIVYRTAKEAKRNFLRPINYILFGPDCHVKYAGDSPCLPIHSQLCDERTIVVKSIPDNTTEDDLLHLFTNCHIWKYCPARTVLRMNTSTTVANKTKTFWGYAFLVYNTKREAASVIEHANQYQINGRPLVISFYRNSKQF